MGFKKQTNIFKHKVSQNALEVLSGVPYFQNFPGGGGGHAPFQIPGSASDRGYCTLSIVFQPTYYGSRHFDKNSERVSE